MGATTSVEATTDNILADAPTVPVTIPFAIVPVATVPVAKATDVNDEVATLKESSDGEDGEDADEEHATASSDTMKDVKKKVGASDSSRANTSASTSASTSIKDASITTSLGVLQFKFNMTKVPAKDVYSIDMRDVLVWTSKDSANSILNTLYNGKYERCNLLRDGTTVWLKVVLRDSSSVPEYAVTYN
jgi:hypothetical protein